MIEETTGSIQVSATEGGQVTVKGDVVGRDKITQIIESAKPLTPHQLPPPPPDFLGREAELRELLAASQKHSVIGLHGLGGVGKTALALKLAEHLASPDGIQFYLDLQSAGPRPLTLTDAMLHVVRACYPQYKQPESVAELRGAYNSVLYKQRALLVFDNADRIAAHFSQLLPPAGCFLIWTARQRMDVAGQFSLELKPLLPIDAQRLLAMTAPRMGSHAEAIARLCGYLPLALKAAGSLLAIAEDLDPAQYAAKLRDERTRLAYLKPDGAEANLDVEASFNTSYALLPSETARVFRWLSVFEGPFAAALEEVVCADPGHASLSALVQRSLVEYNQLRKEYYLHDLMRLFAARRLAEAGAGEHADFETHFLRALGDPARQRTHAMLAGRTLLHLGWKPARMRTPVLQALARLMREPDGDDTERRAAALLLTRLQWLDDVRITADEMLAYLELIARYVDSRADREYLERHLTVMLNTPPDILSEAQQAQLLARRAAFRGTLGHLREAEEDYRQATGWIEKIATVTPLSKDLIHLLARVQFGMGNIIVQQTEPEVEPMASERYAGEWRNATDLYRSALELAQTHGHDSILTVNIQRELNYVHALLLEWDEAEKYCHDALNILKEEQGRLGTETFNWWHTQMLEVASDTHLRKGQWCVSQSKPDQALIEFRLAHRFALEEIASLRCSFGKSGDPGLAYAHNNAGDSLWGIHECQSAQTTPPVHRPDVKACTHWRRAWEIAVRLGIEEMAQQAVERLERHCR